MADALADLYFDETREEMAYWFKPDAATPAYVRPTANPDTWWGKLVTWELRTLWALRRGIDRAGWSIVMRQFISNNPWRDVSLLTWCVTVLGWYEYGIKMVWLTVPNAFAIAVLRAVFQAPRPFEFDRRLRPLADRQQAGYGCPSIETHMAVVTFGYMAHRRSNPAWQIGTAFVVSFIGLSRLYAGSRFVHQVVISALTGSASLAYFVLSLEDLVPDWNADPQNKNVRLALLAPWALAALAYVCLAIEDNSSWLLRTPNSEFVRVMAHILDTGAAAAQREGAAANPGDQASMRGRGAKLGGGSRRGRPGDNGGSDDDDDDLGNDNPTMGQYAPRGGLSALEKTRRRLAARRDSFYHLQHTMRNNDVARVALRRREGYLAGQASDSD